MGRKLTAWWAKPGRASPETAEQLLRDWRPAIERRISWYERQYPGEVDWEPVIWDGAYRAAFSYRPGDGFWKLLERAIWHRTTNSIARHKRRRAKLVKRALITDRIDDRFFYR